VSVSVLVNDRSTVFVIVSLSVVVKDKDMESVFVSVLVEKSVVRMYDV
jgi:hypothetical protein